MKTTMMLVTLSGMLPFGLQGVVATCYGSGDSWGSTELARSFVHSACYDNGGMFTGNFAPRQTKSMCPRNGQNLGLLFEVQNLNANTGFDLGNDDCYERLNNEIFACAKGGESTVAGWRFR